MRKVCVAGNWKMHKTVEESRQLIKEIISELEPNNGVIKIICPPFTSLASSQELVKDTSIHLGAQNLYWEEQGAFTGEISPPMIKELAEYVIVGHSERRAYFHDTDQTVNLKIKAALRFGLKPIFCVGETLEENESGRTAEVVSHQITAGLDSITHDQVNQIMIAYEPVWAIGTGKAATPEVANQIIKQSIREVLADLYSSELAESVLILYGGSVKPENASDFFAQQDIDGALVGGASLRAADFVQITEAAV